MKHAVSVTILILLLFISAQFIGILILTQYIDSQKSQETGQTEFKDLPVGERPPLEEKTSFIPIMISIIVGTIILLLLIKHKLAWVWKGWFLLAIILTLTISFSAFVHIIAAFLAALILSIWKVFKPNFWIHNFTELFVYAGMAVIFVPLFTLSSIIILLILIAIYDAYSVWKSKHMITLATSEAKEQVFAGLLIPYSLNKGQKVSLRNKANAVSSKVQTAILGGGDIGFPLLFAGVILKEIGLWQSLIIPVFAGLGLGILLWKSEEKKFYPAMPFIGAGCLLGLGIAALITFV